MTSPEYRTLVDRLRTLSREDRALTFVDGSEESVLTYAELGRRAREVGRRLAGLGFRKGDRLVMVLPDQRDFVELFLGAARAGVVPVPVFPPFMLGQLDAYRAHLARVVAIAEPRAIVTSDEVAALLEPAALPVPSMRFGDVSGATEEAELPTIQPDDLAFIQFTSGSTAQPKGVTVTHRALMANVTAISRHFGVDGDRDRPVSWLPLYHDMGLIGFLFGPMITEASTWYLSPLAFARHPPAWCDLIHRVRGTIAFGPNFAFGLVARRATDEQVAEWDLSSWRIAGCGAEPIRAATLREFVERLAPAGFAPEALLPSYGMAEATLAITLTPIEAAPRIATIDRGELSRKGRAVPAGGDADSYDVVSCGAPLEGHELRIVADGEQLPDGREGEIVFRGPSVTSGYFRDDAATAQAYAGGWLHTGDLGFVRDGELYVTGRVKDLLIVAGRNHHPQDIEWCAEDEPGVRRGNAVAFSVANGDSGEERPIVAAEARGEVDPDELGRRIARRVRGQLGLTLAEVLVAPRDTLPKTTSGKVRRRETRRMYLEGELEARGGLRPDVVEASPAR